MTAPADFSRIERLLEYSNIQPDDLDALRDELAAIKEAHQALDRACEELGGRLAESRRTVYTMIFSPKRFRAGNAVLRRTAPDSLDVYTASNQWIGGVYKRIGGGWLAHADAISQAAMFTTEAEAVDWLSMLAEVANWADQHQTLPSVEAKP